ncbi:MAG: protein kinase, partial [Gemmatimonadaceae bacterium]
MAAILNVNALFQQLQESLGTAYTVQRELGGGGMSQVYLAVENRFQRRVVIKVLSPELSEGLSGERFEREIGLAAGLQQANIVPVITAGYVNGLPWYSMPFVDGETLRVRMLRGAVPVSEAVAILKDIARALAYAHEQGIVHRDIKPENVLLSGDAAVVADFGIAKALSASKTRAPGGTLTRVGTSIGTPAYMAPEQAVGGDVDHRADIYSWGVIAYELVAHHHPFAERTTAQQLIAAHIAETPRALPASTPAAALIARTLSKNPDDRPSSAKELIDALNSVVTTGNRVQAVPSRRRAAIAAGVGIVMLLSFGIFVARRSNSAAVAPDTSAINTIAVLPFVNTSGNAQDEYFSDGMTDELAHALSQLPGLRLTGRTSAFSFKGKSVNASDIGKALAVAGIVEGTVRRSGDRLRVTASLTSTIDGKRRWSDSYESSAKDVFTVQDELTKAMVTALAPALRGDSPVKVAEHMRGTNDAIAYDDYLKGRHFWELRGTVNLVRAVENFRRAIKRDPSFARAYAGLAMVYAVLPGYAGDPMDTLTTASVLAAKQALSLDSTLTDAKLALAYTHSVQGRTDSAEL